MRADTIIHVKCVEQLQLNGFNIWTIFPIPRQPGRTFPLLCEPMFDRRKYAWLSQVRNTYCMYKFFVASQYLQFLHTLYRRLSLKNTINPRYFHAYRLPNHSVENLSFRRKFWLWSDFAWKWRVSHLPFAICAVIVNLNSKAFLQSVSKSCRIKGDEMHLYIWNSLERKKNGRGEHVHHKWWVDQRTCRPCSCAYESSGPGTVSQEN